MKEPLHEDAPLRAIPSSIQEDDDTISQAPAPEARSIRNVIVPNRSRPPERRETQNPFAAIPTRAKGWRTSTLSIIAVLAVLIVGGLGLFFFRKTTITVIPRSHTVVFDTNTATIESDQSGSLHKKVEKFQSFVNDTALGLQVVISDTGAGVAYVLIP